MRAPATRLDPSDLFGARLHWIADSEFPWLTATYGGEAVFLRLNTSFPDQPLYSLLVDQDETCDFDDLPAGWSRGPMNWPGRTQ